MIVITTPTGAIGRQVLEHVIRGAEPVRVIVRVRRRSQTRDMTIGLFSRCLGCSSTFHA